MDLTCFRTSNLEMGGILNCLTELLTLRAFCRSQTFLLFVRVLAATLAKLLLNSVAIALEFSLGNVLLEDFAFTH